VPRYVACFCIMMTQETTLTTDLISGLNSDLTADLTPVLTSGAVGVPCAPCVHILILNWHGWRDTIECLHSLKQLAYANFVVTVVDNASTDDSVARIREAHPEVGLLVTERNLGFAEGNNFGIRQALERGADYVWLLNNDTLVDADSLSLLVAAAESDPQIGVVGPKIYYAQPPDRIWFAGAVFQPWLGKSRTLGYNEADIEGKWDRNADAAFITGCAMLVKADVWRAVGLLDADYFFIVEDLDFCLRVRRHGLRTVMIADARIWHKVSASSGGEESPLGLYYACRNRLLMMSKLGARIYWPTFLLHFLASYPIQYLILWLLRRRRYSCFAAICLGVRDFAAKRVGPAPGDTQRRLNRMMRR
jgi:GT2 family glycosyltransferase